jgi:hypothetical protein
MSLGTSTLEDLQERCISVCGLATEKSTSLFGKPRWAGFLHSLPQQVFSSRKQFFLGKPAGIDFCQNRSLRFVFPVFDPSFALQHAPGEAGELLFRP